MAGSSVTMQIEGLRELERALVGMAEAAPGIIAKALREPMEPLLLDMKTLVPKRTGELADALDLTPVRRASARRASMADTLSEVGIRIKKTTSTVGTWGSVNGGRLNPRSYWHLVEFGTAHSAAKPFIRPAFDMNAQALITEFKAGVRAGIERTAARYARQTARRKR